MVLMQVHILICTHKPCVPISCRLIYFNAKLTYTIYVWPILTMPYRGLRYDDSW